MSAGDLVQVRCRRRLRGFSMRKYGGSVSNTAAGKTYSYWIEQERLDEAIEAGAVVVPSRGKR